MRRLDEVVDFLRRSGLPARAIHLPDLKGRPGEVIIDHALASGADIVISGAQRTNLARPAVRQCHQAVHSMLRTFLVHDWIIDTLAKTSRSATLC